jgi:hypothetical protein
MLRVVTGDDAGAEMRGALDEVARSMRSSSTAPGEC